jgi:alpha-mannosidase
VIARALSAIDQATDTQAGGAEGVRLLVFNPLPWMRDDVVAVPLAAFPGAAPAWLVDEAGEWVPAQVAADQLIFVATAVPALGSRVYRAAAANEAPTAPRSDDDVTVDATNLQMENGRLRLRVHRASGALDQLVDLATGRDLAGMAATSGVEARAVAGLINRLQIVWEQPHPMSAWHIGDITRVENLITGAELSVVESGPVRGVIEVRHCFLNSSLVQRITLYRGLARIDCATEVDWHERGSAHADAPMLRATFTPHLGQTDATFEVPFAALQRPADGREMPALRWADLSEREGQSAGAMAPAGLALLNDGKYGHQAQGNTLRLTLVRAAYEPDVNPDEGLHRFTYSLYPHAGDWRAAGVAQQGAALNQPLLTSVTAAHGGARRTGVPWLQCDAGNVMISALKVAEDPAEQGRALVVRLFEAHGQAGRATLHFAAPILRAASVSPIEEEVGELACDANTLTLSLAPHAIRTVRVIVGA